MEGATLKIRPARWEQALADVPASLASTTCCLSARIVHAGWTAEKDMYHHREEHFMTAAGEWRGTGHGALALTSRPDSSGVLLDRRTT